MKKTDEKSCFVYTLRCDVINSLQVRCPQKVASWGMSGMCVCMFWGKESGDGKHTKGRTQKCPLDAKWCDKRSFYGPSEQFEQLAGERQGRQGWGGGAWVEGLMAPKDTERKASCCPLYSCLLWLKGKNKNKHASTWATVNRGRGTQSAFPEGRLLGCAAPSACLNSLRGPIKNPNPAQTESRPSSGQQEKKKTLRDLDSAGLDCVTQSKLTRFKTSPPLTMNNIHYSAGSVFPTPPQKNKSLHSKTKDTCTRWEKRRGAPWFHIGAGLRLLFLSFERSTRHELCAIHLAAIFPPCCHMAPVS